MTLGKYYWYKDAYMKRLRLKNIPIIHLANLLVSSGMVADAKLDIDELYPVYREKQEVDEWEM